RGHDDCGETGYNRGTALKSDFGSLVVASTIICVMICLYLASYVSLLRPIEGADIDGGSTKIYLVPSYAADGKAVPYFYAPAHWLDKSVLRHDYWKFRVVPTTLRPAKEKQMIEEPGKE